MPAAVAGSAGGGTATLGCGCGRGLAAAEDALKQALDLGHPSKPSPVRRISAVAAPSAAWCGGAE